MQMGMEGRTLGLTAETCREVLTPPPLLPAHTGMHAHTHAQTSDAVNVQKWVECAHVRTLFTSLAGLTA